MGKLKVSYKQALACISYTLTATFILLVGAVRTGKTRFGIVAMVDWSLELVERGYKTGHDLTLFILAYNFRNIEDTLVPYITQHLDMRGIPYTEHGTHMIYTYMGQRIKINYYGASNARSYRSIQSATMHGGFVDEGALLDPNTVDVAIQRTITYDDVKIWISSNPEGGTEHPFYKQWLANPDKDTAVIEYNIWDNPIISDDKIEQMIRVLPDEIVQRKIYGHWVASAGRIYKRLPDTVAREEVEQMDFKYITIGNDYGEEDKTTSVAVGYDGERYVVIDELVIEDSTMLIDEKERKQRSFINRLANKFGCPITDFNETSHKAIYKMKSEDVKISTLAEIEVVYKGKRDPHSKSAIGERIDLVNVMIAFDKLVLSDHLTALPRALETAVWKDGVRLDNGTTDIDTLDGFEYAIIEDYEYIMKEVGLYEDRNEYAN